MAAPPNVMADVKDWLLNKCRDAGSLLAVERPVLHGGRHLSFNNVVVTPSNIPEFTIPDGSLSPPGKECSDTDSAGSSSGSNTCSSSSPHRYLYRQRPSYNHLLPAHQSCSKSRSAPVSPMRSMGERQSSVSDLVFSGVEGFCDEAGFVRHTNSDPMSLAALSLPYLKLQTKFGFETLSESPHTRRKESLFHVDGGSDDHSCEPASGLSFTCRHAKQKMPGSLEAEDADHRHMPITCRRNKRRHNVPAVIAPLGVVLTPNAHTSSMCDFALRSPYNHCVVTSFPSQMDLSPSDTHRYNTPGGSAHSAHQQSHAHHLRRASLREDASRSVRSSSSSAEVSPSVFRRHNSTQHLQMPQSEQELMDSACTVKAHSSATMSSEGLATSPCSSCRSVHSFPDLKEASIGEVRISLNYLPKLRQLKVGLLRIENLSRSSNGVPSCRSSQCRGSTDGGSLSTAMVTDQTDMLNSYVKLYLMPGKTQRQVSKVVRHSNNPVFNQDFVFNDVHRHQLKETRLHVKVCHKAPKLGRDEPLGQLQLPLDGLVPCQDTRFFRELDPPTSKHDLGYIHMSVCFHASAEKLTVSVTQVTDLARHTFTGAPDPYVRIELSQPRRTTLVQNTKTKKKNTAPVFNESFTFTISPKIDDLHDTKLTITVLDRSTLMSDGIIGQVRLGYGATEEAEFYHWNQVLQQPGRLATNWHMLMDPLDD